MLLDLIVFRFVLLPVPAGFRSSPGIAEGSSCAARCAGFDTLCSKVIPNAVSCQNDSRFDSSVTFSFRHVLFWQKEQGGIRIAVDRSFFIRPSALSFSSVLLVLSGLRVTARNTGRLSQSRLPLSIIIAPSDSRAFVFVFAFASALHYLRVCNFTTPGVTAATAAVSVVGRFSNPLPRCQPLFVPQEKG